MKFEECKLTYRGKKIRGFRFKHNGKQFAVIGAKSRSDAEKILKARSQQSKSALNKSLRKFEEFNFRPAKKLTQRDIPTDLPFIEIGRVPEITYMSRKEGKLT